MKHLICIWIVLCFLLSDFQKVRASSVPESYVAQRAFADSIMDKVIFFAPFYERIIDDYRAELYIKGWVNIRKKNHLIRFIPSMFRIQKGVREYMMETYSDLHFTAPNIYDQKVKASVGTSSEFWEWDGRLPEYFHINIYSSTLLYDKLLSPLATNAKKYYTYYVDSIMGETHKRQYRIRFMPKSKSFQLVGGYMVVSDNVWSIREIRFAGRNEMLRFNNLVRMGEVGAIDEFLPKHYNIDVTFRFFGNVIEGKIFISTTLPILGKRKIRRVVMICPTLIRCVAIQMLFGVIPLLLIYCARYRFLRTRKLCTKTFFCGVIPFSIKRSRRINDLNSGGRLAMH